MRKLKVSKIWIPAFLLAVLVVGCSDPDKNAGAGNPGDQLTPPTVVSVSPPDGACLTTPVTATFSKAMNPATINTTTFTLAGPNGASSVAGAVSLDSTGLVATFQPTSALTGGAAYVATITTGVADTFGNHLAADRTWTFTTGTQACATPVTFGQPGCGTGILAASAISNTGPSIVTGDVDISPAGLSSITGFPPGTFTGQEHGADPTAAAAQLQLTAAHNAAAGAPGGVAIPADIGGNTYAPGVYTAPGTLAITGILTLTGPGTFIFQIPTAMTTAAGGPGTPASQVILSGGALAQNVFWETGTAAVTLGSYSTFAGTIMAHTSITLGTGAVLNGRAQAQIGAVTLTGTNTINVPPCQ
jgi:ice-binding like protein/Big-like domain-containing protein